MPQAITIIRHGQSEYNQLGKAQGQLDSALTRQGVVEAERLATRLRRTPVDVIYSSDLSRALDTARIIRHHHSVPLITTSLIRERKLGQLAGTTKKERRAIADRYGLHGEFWEWHSTFLAHLKVESKASLRDRLSQFWHRLTHYHADEHVILVTHGGVIGELVELIAAQPAVSEHWFVNTSVSRLTKAKSNPLQYNIQYINDHSHLKRT